MSDEPKPGFGGRRLHLKLAEIASEIKSVPKNGRNTFHKYDYVTEADLIEAVRSKLTSRNIVLMPSVREITTRPGDESKASTVTTVMMDFTFIDADTGETLVASWAGTGADAGDKGLYKAYTGALKYFLMKAFQVPTGDDPEADHGSGGSQAQAAPAPVATITKKRATSLVEAIWAAGRQDKCKLILSSASGQDLGPCDTKEQAIAAASKLTDAQASVIEERIAAHAAEQDLKA